MQTWTHPVITGGKPVIIHKLNLRGLRAVVQKQAELKRAGEDAALGNVDLFVVMAHETLRRSLPDIKPDAVLDLEVDEMKALSDVIVAANPDLAKKASEGNAKAS